MAGMATASAPHATRTGHEPLGPCLGEARPEQEMSGRERRHTSDDATTGAATITGHWPAPGTIHDAWTVADLNALPDDGLRYEIIDGVLIVSPSPAIPHQHGLGELYFRLRTACPPGLNVYFAPLDWTVSDTTVFQPDLMVVRCEDATGERLTGTPVLAVEIASPSTAGFDRTHKFHAYAEAGLGQFWIVDPGSNGSAASEPGDPSIEIYDLTESGDYELQVRGVGDEQVTVAGPVPVSVTPANLMA